MFGTRGDHIPVRGDIRQLRSTASGARLNGGLCFDSFFETKIAKMRIPGAAIVVVQGGEVLPATGYAYRDGQLEACLTDRRALMDSIACCGLVCGGCHLSAECDSCRKHSMEEVIRLPKTGLSG
jgi:hypothetical protein